MPSIGSKTNLSGSERKLYDRAMRRADKGITHLNKAMENISLLSTVSSNIVDHPDKYTNEQLERFINLAGGLQVEHAFFRSPFNNIDNNLKITKYLISEESAERKVSEEGSQ